jgi:hypothetical protein
VVFNDAICGNCNTMIGAVAHSQGFPLVMVICLGVVAFVIFGGLGSWLTSPDEKQPNGHKSAFEQPAWPSAREPFTPGNLPSEGDIRSVVKAFTDDWNKSNVTDIRSLWCSRTAPDATVLSKQIDWYGHIETSVRDIGGSGDEASAEITVTTSHGGEMEPWWFVKEGGSWKPCKVSFLWDRVPPGH